ncbi:hypothetical protein ABZ807_20390 [Micromonospora sp. NPDC047548]|uniref:hypothetical protein n=1 Tax=Micromonospora sp. NPDC047548 TaxID=3155624 RepID=UPI003401EC42
MPQPQPGADRPADGSTPVTDVGREPAVAGEPAPSPVPEDAGPRSGPEGTLELPADRADGPGGPERTAAEPVAAPSDEATAPTSPAPVDAAVPPTPAEPSQNGPEPTRVEPEPPAPRWSGSAAVPPPPPRRRAWGESAEPTPVPPAPVELPEHRTPVDPWAGADTGSWELEHHHHLPALPPTLPHPVPPPTRPYSAAPPPSRPYPAPPAAAHPVSPPPVSPSRPAPPPPPPAPPRPPTQRRGRRPEAVAPPPGWQAPRGYVPVPVRRRRRWPWVLLLSLLCCCGCPAWFGKPLWEQYPADAALPGQVADLTLRQDAGSQATAERLKAEVRAANLLSEDVFAGVYGTGDGKRVTVFGGTGFRFNPESGADDEMTRLAGTYRLDTPQPAETGVRGRYERCATGRSDGTDVVVCTSADHGSITTAVFTRLSVDDSARLLDTLRKEIVTPRQS